MKQRYTIDYGSPSGDTVAPELEDAYHSIQYLRTIAVLVPDTTLQDIAETLVAIVEGYLRSANDAAAWNSGRDKDEINHEANECVADLLYALEGSSE